MLRCRSCSSLIKGHYLHKPKGSEIDLQIYLCKKCNLIQGFCDEKKYSEKNDNFKDPNIILSEISCDSKYSNIRVGKQQMADKFFLLAQKKIIPIDFSKISSVLDVRSARGSFILRAKELFQSSELFIGLEQDHYLYPDFQEYKKTNVIIKDESIYTFKYEKKFDFIYSCHTFEHYRNPIKYIQSIKRLISKKGYLFIDVPNTTDFVYSPSLDDFFYDKHLIYFEPKTLINILENNGFSVIWIRSAGNGCIECLAKLKDKNNENINLNLNKSQEIELKDLTNYSDKISKLRTKLPLASEKLKLWLDNYDNKIAIGSGRILDAFMKYGTLNKDSFDKYVDNYLFDATKEVNGLRISKLHSINLIPNAAILFTRQFNIELKNMVKKINPNCQIRHWKEFF